MKNAVCDKQIFVVFDESTLSDIQYLNILIRSLEHLTSVICLTANLYHVRQIAIALLKQLMMLLDLLESAETFSVFCCLMMQNLWWMQVQPKSKYLKLFHVIRVAHLLHNCAKKVKSHFEDVDQLFAKVKSATVINKARRAKFAIIVFLPLRAVAQLGNGHIFCKEFT